MLDLLCELTGLAAPSGYEDQVASYLAKRFRSAGAKVTSDGIGNVIGCLERDQTSTAVMVCAHMDEVGLMVQYIGEDGAIYFDPHGMINHTSLPGTPVEIHGSKGTISGVVGTPSAHMTQIEKARRSDHEELWIDVGAGAREEAERLGVQVGSTVTYASNFTRLAGDRFRSKALDDRMGCALLVSLIESLRNTNLSVNLYFVATVQEEIGGRGAKVASQTLNPSVALVLDTVSAEDPSTLKRQTTARLGQGPVLRTMDMMTNMTGTVYSRRMRDRLAETASSRNIPLQFDISKTWTDAASIQTSQSGIPVAGLFMPRRYSHSPGEVAQLSDLEATLNLTSEFLRSLDSRTVNDFRRPNWVEA